MSIYVIRRLLLVIPTLFLVTIIVFFAFRLVPSNVIDMMVDEQYFSSGMDRLAIERALGLDAPAHVQYGRWVWGIMRGDFGKSLWSGTSVAEEILPRFPVTFELGILAIIIGILISIPIGTYSAVRQNTVGDYIARSFAILAMAMPGFWLGTMVIVFPSIWWGWTPSVEYIPFSQDPIGNLGMLIIPASILALGLSGMVMRMMRTMVLEVLRQDYIRTAWSKGLKERLVITRHALRNALIPVVTLIGLQLPIVIAGSVIIEQIFCLPGMGRLLVESLNNRDFIVVCGVVVLVATWVLVANLIVDLSYAYLDPRVHYK